MTIEITRGSALFTYRIDPANDPRQILWRRNEHNARWQPWGEPFPSALEARQALLTLTQGHGTEAVPLVDMAHKRLKALE
jgi:hypothetical protein